MKNLISFVCWGIPFWAFVAIKAAGHTFALWSWWWLLLPQIPVLGLLVRHWGL